MGMTKTPWQTSAGVISQPISSQSWCMARNLAMESGNFFSSSSLRPGRIQRSWLPGT